MLLLSRSSCVRPCATPQMAAHQAPLSSGFSRQEHWSGLPFPSPMHEVKSESEVAQLCLTLSNPMACSPPGSSIHGIFQARRLEWGASAFSAAPPCPAPTPWWWMPASGLLLCWQLRLGTYSVVPPRPLLVMLPSEIPKFPHRPAYERVSYYLETSPSRLPPQDWSPSLTLLSLLLSFISRPTSF